MSAEHREVQTQPLVYIPDFHTYFERNPSRFTGSVDLGGWHYNLIKLDAEQKQKLGWGHNIFREETHHIYDPYDIGPSDTNDIRVLHHSQERGVLNGVFLREHHEHYYYNHTPGTIAPITMSYEKEIRGRRIPFTSQELPIGAQAFITETPIEIRRINTYPTIAILNYPQVIIDFRNADMEQFSLRSRSSSQIEAQSLFHEYIGLLKQRRYADMKKFLKTFEKETGMDLQDFISTMSISVGNVNWPISEKD